ncbi:MAG: hypothetical protein HQL19_00845 [Candidatus Omnitrophica bacterium]|nr:hypothetical protein [Candidatus Omnitrophota bacterium]
MIVVFPIIIIAGIIFFVWSFLAEKNEAGPEVIVPSAVQPTDLEPQRLSSAESLTGAAQEKYLLLERMLEEKNRALERFERELFAEERHRREFESLRDILQKQIEELKEQNRRLKEEISKVFEENLQLQSRLSGVESEKHI